MKFYSFTENVSRQVKHIFLIYKVLVLYNFS